MKDDAGDTALHTAIRVGSETLVLVSINCHITWKLKQILVESLWEMFLPLYNINKAFLYYFTFQTLLQQGHSDANALGRNSYTPLHLAAEMDNEKICQILVRGFL